MDDAPPPANSHPATADAPAATDGSTSRSRRTVRPFDVTLRAVFAIAIPMTFAHLTTPLIGITDLAVIGQLGNAALIGAVALGAILFDFLGTTFNFLRMGTTGLVAQAYGADDREAEALTLWRALVLALGAGFAIIALSPVILWAFLAAMGASDAVSAATRDYYGARVMATPFMFANYAILGWLLGLGRSGTGLALQTLLALVNIALSLVLVLGFGLGVAGVAAASVVAEAVAMLAGIAVVARALGKRPLPTRAALLERVAFARMLGVNRDLVIRSFLLVGAFTFFSAVGARFGDATLAANAVLMNFFLLGAYILDGLATAAEQLGGRACGANYRPAFDKTVRLTVTASLALSGLLTLGALGAGGPAIDLMTTAEEVRAIAREFLVYAALTPFVGALAFAMDGLYIGATWTGVMRNMMIVSALLFLAIWWVATPLLGNHGLWLALLVFLGARGLTLLAYVPAMARRSFPG